MLYVIRISILKLVHMIFTGVGENGFSGMSSTLPPTSTPLPPGNKAVLNIAWMC